MAHDTGLISLSNTVADIVDAASSSVVQVHGRRRPVSGVVYAEGVVVTLARALGRENGLHVRSADGSLFEAELAGWDPATGLVVLRVAGLRASALSPSAVPTRVGHLAVAIARSWSNAVTASVGTVAVIGGPLSTGRRRSIEQVIRTSAPMHDGFAGGAFVGTDGQLVGITTAASIRGFGVVIPSAIAWKTVEQVLQHGRPRLAYLGIAGQVARLSASQANADRQSALLVVGVSDDSPAAGAGVLVGDVILDVDDKVVRSPEDLLDLLSADSIGRELSLRLLRGTAEVTVAVTPTERPER
jgi:S1-C subfamily serine protease